MPDRSDLTVPIRVLNSPKSTVKGSSVTVRAVVTGCIVALISVFVTALIAIPLAVQSAEKSARESLATQANAVATVLKIRNPKRVPDSLPIIEQLRKQNIDAYLVMDGKSDPVGLPDRLVQQVISGNRVSERFILLDGRLHMVEGRPIGEGTGIVLAREAATGLGKQVLRSLWLPLFAGLGAGVLAGVLLGRRLARPIRNAAIAAARLSSGDRGVRLAIEPPAEVGRLAESINDLASALANSEGRQREFLLSISHELRTPLTTIRGYAEALSDGVVDSESAAGAGRTILTEAERLDRLVADLLSLARLEAADFAIELTNVDLGELIASAEVAFTPRCTQHGVRLRIERPATPVIVSTDPVRLRQIVDGLMENALRIVPPGKPIVLAVGSDAGRAIVEVRDGGPGLTDDDLAVAFERGALHQRYQGVRKVGSGLGLALAAGLVKRLGGTIEAGHAPEGGARFTVYLPQTRN
ncbi:MAG TPA: two-component sensor histidine kinase [Micromonosporaceae bacterium]|nr:two-component sensor histidine kinase [Micromonosporaceae bacterium]HCU48333.1 two-component sensor histidine kinase [Micromonosporaceae bacterium]